MIVGVILLLSILLLMYQLKKMNISSILKYIGSACIGGLLVFLVMKFTAKTVQPADCPPVEKQVILIDTCLQTADTVEFKSTTIIKPGRKTASVKVEPDKQEVKFGKTEKEDTTIATKYLDNGLVKVWDTVYIQNNAVMDWKRSFQIDTTVLQSLTRIVDRIVLQPSVTKETVYVPTENNSKWLGLSGRVWLYEDVFNYGTGLNYRTNKYDISILKNIKSSGGEIHLNVPLIKVNK